MSDDLGVPLCLAEGPETGLSVWAATGHETWVALGAMGNHEPLANRLVLACRDDDPLQSPADKALTRALARWQQTCADVRVATPWAERRGDRSDFNDVLQSGGEDAVRARIDYALAPEPAPGLRTRLPVAEARAVLNDAVAGFFAAAETYDERKGAALDTAHAAVAVEFWNNAPADVRQFKLERDAWRVAREVTRAARHAAVAARMAVKAARIGSDRVRDQFRIARVAVAEASRAARAAARSERERRRGLWRDARGTLVAARPNAAAARVERQAARNAQAEARRKLNAHDDAVRLKREAEKIERRIASQAKVRATQTAGQPPIHGVRVDVGCGKSTQARRFLAIRLAEMRGAGDDRTGLFMVPTIKLADEQAGLFRALPDAQAAGLKVEVWRGRERPDPDHPDFNDPNIPETRKTAMCRDLDAVNDAQEALADIQSNVCRQRNPDGTTKRQCRFFDECGYQKQGSRRADVWFAAHEVIFQPKPAAMGTPAFTIVDESAWQDGLIGIGADERILSLDTLAEDASVPDAPIATERLRFLRQRMVDALSSLPDGPIPRAAIEATGITSQSASEARALEWRRKVDAAISPGMRPSDRKAAVKAAQINKTIARLSLFWRAIEDLMRPGGPKASGWAALTLTDTRRGVVRALELKGRKGIGEAFHLPTLILDATMQPEPLRYFWTALEVTADIVIRAPYQHVVQVQDRTYSKNHLRQANNIRDLRAILFRLAREYAPDCVLCVIQKEFEETLRERGILPANLDLAHHNDISGKDGWRDVAALIVIGRTAAAPQAMEQLAEALSGEAIPRSTTWYPQTDAVREVADGSFRLAQSDQHLHHLAEACRWSVAESEIVQIIGRARGCTRSEQDPVDIWVLGNMPLPLPVNRLISASDLTPSPGDLMAAEGGVELTNPTDASEAYPDLWPSRDAAKKAMERRQVAILGTNPYKRGPIRECPQVPMTDRPGMVRLDYQLAGRGQRPTMAWFDLAMVQDPTRWLSDRLGELAWVRVMNREQAARDTLAPGIDAAFEVPGGYGDRPAAFPGMEPSNEPAISDVFRLIDGASIVLLYGTRFVFSHGPDAVS